MKKTQANQLFVETYYPDNLRQALKADRLAVQTAWEVFIDSLCKNGDITQEQYDSWVFPWR